MQQDIIEIKQEPGKISRWRDPAKVWVVVVGSGASCYQFLYNCIIRLQANRDNSIGFVVIDPRNPDQDGRGVAWSSQQSELHFANMHLQTMGETIPLLDGDYARVDNSSTGDLDLFKSRREIGDKLHALWQQLLGIAADSGIHVERLVGEVHNVRVNGNGYDVHYREAGSTAENQEYAEYIVFALGHFASTKFSEFRDHDRFVHNPWNWDEIKVPDGSSAVGVLGLGPTSVDVISVLREQGYTGRIEGFSRSGLLQYPRPKYDKHEMVAFTEAAVRGIQAIKGEITLQDIASLLIAEFCNAGCDLKEPLEVVDILRGDARTALNYGLLHADRPSRWFSILKATDGLVPLIWSMMGDGERKKYMRDWRSLHTSISYGMVPFQAARVMPELRKETLQLHSGFKGLKAEGDGFWIEYETGGQPMDRRVDYLINCTGIGSELESVPNELVQNLLSSELILPHPFGGCVCDFETGQILGEKDSKKRLYTMVGSLNHGTRLLTNCYGEVEQSAKRLSESLLQRILSR